MALSLLQGYSSHSSEGSDSESEDDGIIVTIDRGVVAGTKAATKRPHAPGPPRDPRHRPRHRGPAALHQEAKREKPAAAAAVVVSTLAMPHYDLGQSQGGGEGGGIVAVPRVINDMFLAEEEDARALDDPALHEGRLRSFAHCANSWASYVYIDLEGLDLGEARDLLVTQLDMEPIPNPHLSLSRVVSLRHHWLDPLMGSLTESLGVERRFHLGLDRLQAYVNDEGTRTFVGLAASAGWPQLSRLSRKVDSCLAEYALPPFYRPPSFHCSLAWCLGDRRSAILARLQKLSLQLVDCLEDEVQLVREVHCKAGNKLFKFNLI